MNTNNTYRLGLYILIGGVILLIIFGVLVLFALTSRTTPPSTVTPTSVITSTPLQTSPKNNATNVPVDTTIQVFYTQPLPLTALSHVIVPDTQVSVSSKGNTIVLTPTSPLLPGTLYTVSVTNPNSSTGSYIFSFTTVGPTRPPSNFINNQELIQKEQQNELQNSPDVYLVNHTPYSSSTFSISSSFLNTPTPHWAFTVTLTGADKTAAKQDVLNWLHSLELTDQQISGLAITYQ